MGKARAVQGVLIGMLGWAGPVWGQAVPPAVPAQPAAPAQPGQPPAAPAPQPGQPPAAQPGQPMAGAQAPPPKPVEWPKEINGRSLSEWINDLSASRNPDASARDAALRVIPQFGPEARKLALKALCTVIETDPDPGLRINAMITVSGMGFETRDEMKTAAESIRVLLGKTAPGSMIRLHGARTLATFGPEASVALPGIAGILDDPSWETRQAAAAALGRLGAPIYDDKAPPTGALPEPKRPASRMAMDKLMFNLIKDPSAGVRMEACQSLLAMGPPSNADPNGYIKDIKPYLDVLSSRLKLEKDPSVRCWLLLLEMMYDDRSFTANIPTIGKTAETGDPSVRIQALNALTVLGPRAQPALSSVRQCLSHTDPNVLAAALVCLGAIGEPAKSVIPDLEKMKTDTKDESLKKALTETIATIQGMKKEAAMPKKEEPKKP